MDKCLERHGGDSADGCDFIEGQFAGHDELGKTQRFKKPGLVGRAQVTLGAGVKGYGWQVKAQQGQVLHNKGIHAHPIQVVDKPFHLHQFVVIDEGVDRGIYACSIAVGVVTGAAHVVKCVGGIGSGPVVGCAHIHGIGAMVNGGNGDVGVAGWR